MKKKIIIFLLLISISIYLFADNKKILYEGNKIKYLLSAYRDFDFFSEEKINLDDYLFEVEYFEEYVKVRIYPKGKDKRGGDAIYIYDLDGKLRKRILGA